MKQIKTILIPLLCFVQFSSIGQKTNFLSHPEFEISITPKIPLVCAGQPTTVSCNEEFESYEWEGVGFEFQAFDQQVKLTEPGQYTLTVKSEIDGIYYYKILNFYSKSKDFDRDGICDQYDCLPSNPFAAAGLRCDDGDSCTDNDTFNLICKCVGTPISDCSDKDSRQHASNHSELKNLLAAAFSEIIQKDYKYSSDFDSFFNRLSTVPSANKLLDDDVKKEIRKLTSSEIVDLFSDIKSSRYTPGYLGNDLEAISGNTIKAWKGLSKTPILFRTKTSIQDSVSGYMMNFEKSPNDVALEIANSKKGHDWWYHYVLGRKYWIPFLNDLANIKAFAAEIIAFNKQTEGKGNILSGSPSSAINTALYYDDVLEQGASIFKTIVKNHMFYDGNKRTAASTIISFMKKAGIPINKSDRKIFKLAKKVATDQVVEVSEIANKLIK